MTDRYTDTPEVEIGPADPDWRYHDEIEHEQREHVAEQRRDTLQEHGGDMPSPPRRAPGPVTRQRDSDPLGRGWRR